MHDLELNFSPSVDFTEHISKQFSSSGDLLGLLYRTHGLREGDLGLFVTHVQLPTEFGAVAYPYMRQWDRIAVEVIQ